MYKLTKPSPQDIQSFNDVRSNYNYNRGDAGGFGRGWLQISVGQSSNLAGAHETMHDGS